MGQRLTAAMGHPNFAHGCPLLFTLGRCLILPDFKTEGDRPFLGPFGSFAQRAPLPAPYWRLWLCSRLLVRYKPNPVRDLNLRPVRAHLCGCLSSLSDRLFGLNSGRQGTGLTAGANLTNGGIFNFRSESRPTNSRRPQRGWASVTLYHASERTSDMSMCTVSSSSITSTVSPEPT